MSRVTQPITGAAGREHRALGLLATLVLAGCNGTPATCASSRDCPGQVCDLATSNCVDCSTSVDCPEAGQVCLDNQCVVPTPCVSSRQCPDAVCDTTRGFCVDCLTALDCGASETCESSRCVPGGSECVSDRQCSGTGQVCDSARGVCVACVRDTDCAGGAVCRANTCVAVGVDAGSTPTDAGTTPTDAGTTPTDAGTTPTDAGPRDAGAAPLCVPTSSTLVITEVFGRTAFGLDPDLGEWFEVHNRSDCALDLSGLVIESPTGGGTPVIYTVPAGVTVAPRNYFVFARTDDSSLNHGTPVDHAYDVPDPGVGTYVTLSGVDSLTLSLGGATLDSVAWSVPPDAGASRQLSALGLSADNSDLLSAAYCYATSTYASYEGSPLLGTPGAANRACP